MSKQQAEKNVEAAGRTASAAGAGTSGAGGPAAAGSSGPAPMDATPSGAPAAVPAAATRPTPAPGSNPAPAQQQQPAGAAAPPATAGVNEAAVSQLVGLGFSRQMAVEALNAMGGDVDAAAAMLFGM